MDPTQHRSCIALTVMHSNALGSDTRSTCMQMKEGNKGDKKDGREEGRIEGREEEEVDQDSQTNDVM